MARSLVVLSSVVFLISVLITKTDVATAETDYQEDCHWEYTEPSECFYDPSLGVSWKDKMVQITPGVYNGSVCNMSVNHIETLDCSDYTGDTTLLDFETTECNVSESGKDYFRCGNGRCIGAELICNGDDDCGDSSDEFPLYEGLCPNNGSYICGIEVTTSTSTTPPRSERYFLSIPGLQNFALGYDLLRGKSAGEVLSMRPFGSCRRVLKSGESDYFYRLPKNVNSFSQKFSTAEGDGMVFENAAQFVNQTKLFLGKDYWFGGTLGDEESGAGLTQSSRVQSLTLAEIQSQNRFYGVSSSVRVEIFDVTLKSPTYLEMSDVFIQRLFDLPYQNYSYERYMGFVEEFGTHYITSGTLGGEYEQLSVYSACNAIDDSIIMDDFMYDTSNWMEKLLFCQKQSLKSTLNTGITLPNSCKKGSTNSYLVDDSISENVEIMGGSVDTVSGLRQSLSSTTMQSWVATVADYPVLLPNKFKLQKISSLLDHPLPQLTVEQRTKIKGYLDDAIKAYLSPYDASTLCQAALSNGTCDAVCTETEDTLENRMYLTSTSGTDYKCLCACAGLPTPLTCGGIKSFLSLWILLLCLFASLKNYY